MKNNKTKKGIIAAVAALLLVLGLWAGFSSPVSLSADAYATNPYDAEYGYTIEQYRAEMTVERNRKISVKETITVSFEGYNSHGIIRDLPLSLLYRVPVDFATCFMEENSSLTAVQAVRYN